MAFDGDDTTVNNVVHIVIVVVHSTVKNSVEASEMRVLSAIIELPVKGLYKAILLSILPKVDFKLYLTSAYRRDILGIRQKM